MSFPIIIRKLVTSIIKPLPRQVQSHLAKRTNKFLGVWKKLRDKTPKHLGD